MKRKPQGANGERCVRFQILDVQLYSSSSVNPVETPPFFTPMKWEALLFFPSGRFGDRLSWRRIYSAPSVPECNNFEKRAADSVVDEIPNARQVKPSNHFRARCFHLGADARLFNE